MSNGISDLLKKYGTSLEQTRALMPKLTEAVKRQRAIKLPTLPTVPQFFTPEEAKDLGVELEPRWSLKVSPGRDGQEPSFSYITPTGWEITQAGLYVSPEGKRYTPEQLQAEQEEYLKSLGRMPPMEKGVLTPEQLGIERGYRIPEVPPELEEIYGKVFPESDINNLLLYAEAQPEAFYKDILTIGRTEDTEELLERMFPEIRPEQLEEFFAPMAEEPIKEIAAELPETEPEAVFLPMIGVVRKMSAGEKEAAPTWVKAFASGLGDVYSSVAGAARWLGFGNIGEGLSKEAERLHREYTYPDTLGDFEFADLLNPEFYETKIVRAIPFALSLAPLAVGGYFGGVAIASAAGLGTIWSAIVGGFTGAALSRPLESAMEAGGQYDDAIARGKTEKEATAEANEVFRNNMLLAGADAWEIAIALAPTPKWVPTALIKGGLARTVQVAGKMVIVGLSEGGEEVYQDMIQRHARGEEWQLDPISKEVFAIGAVMGMGMGLGGDVISSIVSRSKEDMTPSLKKDFDNAVSDFKEQGYRTDQAELKALDVIAKTPEGEKVVSEAIKEVKAEKEAPEVAPVTPEVTLTKEEALKFANPEKPYIVDEIYDKGLSVNSDGTMTLYHATTKERAPELVKTGIFRTAEGAPDAYGVYFSTSQEVAESYGDGTLVKVRVNLRDLNLDDSFPGRPRMDFQVNTKRGIYKPVSVEVTEREVKPATPKAEAKPTEAEITAPLPEEEEVRRQLNELQKMSEIWSKKLADREEVKSQLAKYVRENLPPNVRGKYVTSVAKVKTDAQLERQIAKVSEFAELNAQKTLKIEIRKEIRKARAKIKDHILKGKFTPEVQRRLDVVSHNLELDRDAARERIAENITAYQEGKLGYEEMLTDNEMLNFAGIDGMSAEELANTLGYIKILESRGKSERQAKQEKATEKIKATRSDISNILTGGKGLKTGIGAVPRGELAAKTGWWDTFVNWQYGIDNLADKLSKLDPTSKPYQSELSKFVAQVHRATHRQVAGTKNAFKKIQDVIRETYAVKSTHDINQRLNALDEEVNLGVFDLTAEYRANHPGATNVTVKMTRDQMIAKYMQMRDPTLNDTFTTGMGWSQDVKDAVASNLTEEEKKLASAIFEFYEGYYDATNEIYQELFNVDMPHNRVYSPIRRDFEAEIAENILTMRDASQYASVLNGSLKARQRNIRPLRFNGALAILSNHIQQMEHFKAWAITMRDMRRVFGNKEVRQAIEQYHGRGVQRLIDTFLNQMARGGIETATTNRAADFLRRNFTKSILAIKPVIMLKQIPSLFGYISEMNPVEFFTGIADFWTNPVAHFKFLHANSEMFKARMEAGFERDIRAAMEKHGKQLISGRGKVTDWFMLQIRLGDTFAVTQGMWAKYKAGLKEGLSQEDAIAAAEDTTGRTQPSFGIDTLSAIQNGGSFLKLLTMFQNQPNKYFRMVFDNARNFHYGRGSKAKAASTILLAWVVLPMMFQYIADAFQWKPERQARAGILGPLNFILIGGLLVQSMWGWLTDQPFDYQISPVAQTGRDLQMIFLKAKKLLNQGLDPYKDICGDDVAAVIEYLGKATGQVLGLPTPYFAQLSKLIRHKFAAGEELQIKDFLFSEWALTPPEKTAEEQVEELNLKLGEPEEGVEDKPLTDKPIPVYDTADWFRDIGKVYDNVLPQDVLDDPNASKESKAWAEYEIARSKSDILPNTALYKINTEDNSDTIINYYQQWKAREKITNLAKLKEFDKLYPKAYLGNVTRQQYSLLVKYLEAEDKDTFLTEHPELRVNPRDEWLKANPTDNARLALAGQAKILSLEAYNEIKKLIKELDIPDDAIPEFTLPPEGSVENYFKYQDIIEEFSANSWEAQLLMAQDNDLREFLEREPIETPITALELKIKHRELFDLYDAYGDKDSPLYIEDDDARDEARDKLRADNSEWVDDMRRIEAIEHEASDTIIESWVERGKLVDEFSGGSSEVKVWLVDHKNVWDWALEQELLTDDGSDWNEPVLRINAKWRVEDDEYDALETDEERTDYLASHAEYHEARYRRKAYSIEDFPKDQIETYVEYYTSPKLKKPADWKYKYWFEDDWFLIEHAEFYKTMLKLKIWQPRELEKVPTRKVFEFYKTWYDLPLGKPRRFFEETHPDLDMWLHLKFGTKLESER